MAITNWDNVLSSITGNIPKAILVVLSPTVVKARHAANEAKIAAKQDPDYATDRADMFKMGSKVTDAARKVMKTGKSFGVAEMMTAMGPDVAKYVMMQVQYNPSSIYLESSAGNQVRYEGSGMGSMANTQVTQIDQPSTTTMSFQLIFDDVNVADAFSIEGNDTGINTSAVASHAMNAAKQIKDGGYSVQAQVEGLLSLLTLEEAREVLFFWSGMSFQGEITSVNARYTMFNSSGHPIRGVVEMSLFQSQSAVNGNNYEKMWNKAFDEAFGSENLNTKSGGLSTAQKALNNSLLNLTI